MWKGEYVHLTTEKVAEYILDSIFRVNNKTLETQREEYLFSWKKDSEILGITPKHEPSR